MRSRGIIRRRRSGCGGRRARQVLSTCRWCLEARVALSSDDDEVRVARRGDYGARGGGIVRRRAQWRESGRELADRDCFALRGRGVFGAVVLVAAGVAWFSRLCEWRGGLAADFCD